MNALRDVIYQSPSTGAGPYGQPAGGGQSVGRNSAGAGFGVNLGGETFRVQLAISGIILTAFVVLLLLHRKGNRFSVKVS